MATNNRVIDRILKVTKPVTDYTKAKKKEEENKWKQDNLKTQTDLPANNSAANRTNNTVADRLLGMTERAINGNSSTTTNQNNNKWFTGNTRILKGSDGPFFSTQKKETAFSKAQDALTKGVQHGKTLDTENKWLSGNGKKQGTTSDQTQWMKYQLTGAPNVLKNPKEYAEYVALNRKYGTKNDNIYEMSDEQLGAANKEYERLMNEAHGKAEERSAAGKDKLNENIMNAADRQTIYDTLATKGVPYFTNFEGDYVYTEPSKYYKVLKDENYIKARPEGYDPTLYNDYDKAIYDTMYGQGAYDNIVNNGTNEEIEAMDAEIAQLWDKVENGGFEEDRSKATDEYFNSIEYTQDDFGEQKYKKGFETTGAEMERRNTIRELEENAPEGEWGYDSSKEYKNIFSTPDSADQVYIYSNIDLTAEDLTDFQRLGKLQPAQFMTKEQKNTFYGYYLNGDKESAQAYYDGLKDSLMSIRTQYRNELEAQMAEDPLYGTIMKGTSILTKPTEGLTGAAMTLMALGGNKDVTNPNSEVWDLTRSNRTARATSQRQWGEKFREWFGDSDFAQKAGETLNGVFYSMADMLMATALGGGAGSLAQEGISAAIAEGTIQFIMSSEATASTMLEQMENGKDPTEAALYAVGSGVIEALTEKYSIEALLKPNVKELLGDWKQFAKYLAKNFITEGSEEVASDIANTLLDGTLSLIYGHEDEIIAEYNELMATGKYSEEEATRIVLMNKLDQLGTSFVSGALSGLLLSGARGLETRTEVAIANRNAGKQMATYNVAENATQSEKSSAEAVNRVGLVNIAKDMALGSDSRELGEKAYNDIMKGKKVSDADYGKIARALLNDTNGSIQATVSNILQERIQGQLEEDGVQAEAAKADAASLVNMIAGTATDADMIRYIGSESMQKLLAQYKMSNEGIGQTRAEVEEETQKAESIRETVSAMIAPRAEVSTKAIENVVKDAKVATQDEINKAEGKVTGNPLQVVTDGKIKEIAETKLEGDGNGKHIQVYFTDGTNADIADVKATNIGAAQVLEFANLNGNKTTSDAFTNALLRNVTKEGNAAALISGAMRIRWDVVTGQKTYNSGLDAKTAGELRTAAEADYAEAEARRLKNYRQINPGKGKTTYNGVAYGTKAFQEAIKGLSRDARTEAVTIGALAKSAGFDVELINDPNSTKEQGSYSANGGIVINLAGEYRDGVRRSALATLPHEITHWLEGNSPEAYKALRQFVLNTQKANGVNLEQRLQNIMDSYAKENVELDMFDAVSEMVAKSCEEVLTDESVIRRLRESDPNTYGKVRKAVSMAITRVKEALGMTKATSSIYAQTIRDYADKLSDLWVKAYEEAKQVKGTGEGREAAQASIQESDAEYMKAVENGNEETQQRMVDDAAEEAGYTTRKLYHGTGDFGFTEFDLERGEQLIFATSDRNVAETYSGETERSRINESSNIDANNLNGTQLLRLAKQYLPKYQNYHKMSQKTRDDVLYNARLDFQHVVNEMKKFMEDNKYSFDDEKKQIAENLINALDEAGKAQNGDEFYEAWGKWDRGTWDLKFMDESLFDEFYNKQMQRMLFHGRRMMNDFLYEGDLYQSSNKYSMEYVFDNQLALELNAALRKGVYELYGKPGKQLVIDAEGSNWNNITPPAELELYGPQKTREIAAAAKEKGYDSVLIKNLRDSSTGKDYYMPSDVYIFFKAEQVKSADPVVYDDNGKVIPLSERFNQKKKDIRYSIADDGTVEDENGDAVAQVLPSGNVTAYSLRTVEDTVNEDLVQALVKQGFTEKEVRKWVADVYGVAKYIADHRQLDFNAVAGTMLKNNQEYVKTLDASTLCAKRLLYQGIFNEIQSMLPNTPLLPDDLIKLINMMKKEGLVTPCAFCYVESRRKMLGKYADEWLKGYKGAYKPTLAEVTTTDGLEKLRNAPEGSAQHQAYEDFVDAMNAKGSANPKVVQLRTDYKGEIRKLTANQIEKVKEIGGLRVQSFSDFETVHLLDMMQAVMDMAAMDLTSQAYTKVPDFAWVFGDTGIKINLSLVGDGNGVDANGDLLFSDTEGMPLQEAMDLRARYGKNVGTILVGMNEEHIIAAMGDDRIDFIIPFHKSGWSKNELLRVSGMSGYKDFTRWQNEKRIATDAKGKPIRSANGKGYKTIPNKKSKISNYGPVNTKQEWDGQSGYWDYSKTGIENAERYLQLCKEDMRLPKFYNFLIDKGDGSYRLPTEEEAKTDKKLAKIRKGYWKTLIDFKMYDNEGNEAPQETVKPVFNMDAAMKIMKDFKGDASKLPTDHKIAKQFVEEKKAENPRKKQWSIQEEMEGDIRSWMMTVKPEALQNDAERELLKHWQNMNTRMELYDKKVHDLSGRIASMKEMVRKDNFKNNSKDAQRKIRDWNVELTNAKMIRDQAMKELAQIESEEGYGKILRKQTQRYNEFQSGKTQAEVADEIENLRQASEEIAQAIRATQKRVAELEKKDSVKEARAILEATKANDAAGYLKRRFNSSWTKTQLRNYIDPIMALAAARKNLDDPELQEQAMELARVLVESDTTNTYEIMQDLRGITITMGKGAQKELHANHKSINDIRDQLAGTGIKIRFGDASNLDTDTGTEGDLRAKFPTMPVIRDDLSAIDQFVEWVNGMRGQENMEFYEEKVNEAYAEVMAQAVSAAAAGNIYTTSDPKARKQILDLVEYIRGMKAETDAAIRTLEKIGKSAETLFGSGKNAAEAAQVLVKNMNDALEYYNLSAKLAMQHAKIDRNTEIIEQLKSENAQKIAKNNEEWRNLIERDKQAQRQAENNRVYRSRINTALKRTFNLLKNQKGMQNIPEYMQGLARELLETFVDNDLNEMRMQKITLADKGQLEEAKRLLTAWKQQDGEFNMADLNDAEDAVASVINMDLLTIYDGIAQLNGEIRGKNKLDTITQRGEILRQVQEAVSEIYSAIRTEGKIQVNRRMIDVQDQAYRIATELNGKNRKEWTGKIGNVMNVLHKGIVSGNMTPEYFFRTIGNAGLTELWNNYHDAENRNGLELKKAQTRLAEIAEKHGYDKWDMKQKITLPLESGDVTLTLGQMMSLWATWKRENTLGPAMSEHLTKGGFYAEEDTRDGLLGRRTIEKKAHRVTAADMQRVEAMLTDEQLAFIDDVVGYMSTDMSELGNEASMAAYGIKMYKEGYYFPFQMWDGIRSRKSNDSGSAAAAQDRAFHPSFSKSRLHGANNALVIGDFMQTAADHIAGMINYATMGLANESLQKTLNLQLQENEDAGVATKRNVWTMMEEAYGQEAMQYLRELQKQLNGGAVKIDKTFYDKLISLFRKNAVAGSLSVALQQPLSYIRAAMMMNPKYLAQALNPATWKGSYKEMLAHSGVAVIKDMGRFDMNFGQSAREFLTPDGLESKPAKVWNAIEEYSTKLPELMDRMTWTRMWSAVKAEQKALHPEMDAKSDEFLEMCGERFNDIMRRTQVYDSVLVKSANMRSQNPFMKTLTSFMAEPTLTLNVLADSVRMAKEGEAGGKAMLARAGATFILSAILQAAVKGLMGSGRTPDEKKTWLENFAYKYWYNFFNEIDPLQLVPGFSDAVTLLKGGELKDDAYGTIVKMVNAYGKIGEILSGGGYRAVEDSIGQLMQLYTGVPLKNIMRDGRAMWNWFIDQPYAERETSGAVLKGQFNDLFFNADNMLGVVNKWLGDAGYDTSNMGYYEQIYNAKKRGDEQAELDLIDYLINGKGIKAETIESKVNSIAKKDESMSAAETSEFLISQGSDSADDYIRDQLKQGNMTAAEARKELKKAQPDKDENEIWWTVDRIEYAKETGNKVSGNSYYYRLEDAINSNSANAIKAAVQELTAHGVPKDNVKKKLSDWKKAYLGATGNEKVRIKNALIMAYKALGYSETEANEIINKWK